GAERVGLDDVGARLDVIAVDAGDELRLRDVELVVAAGEEDAALVEQRAGRSVEQERPLALQRVGEELHCAWPRLWSQRRRARKASPRSTCARWPPLSQTAVGSPQWRQSRRACSGGVMRSPSAAATNSCSRASSGGRDSGACTANTSSRSSAETPAFCAARCCSEPVPCDHQSEPIDTAGMSAPANASSRSSPAQSAVTYDPRLMPSTPTAGAPRARAN